MTSFLYSAAKQQISWVVSLWRSPFTFVCTIRIKIFLTTKSSFNFLTTLLLAEVTCDWSGTFDQNTWSCCSVTNKCKEAEGDCDSNNQCEGDLECGFNNCKTLNPNNAMIDPLADCCTSQNRATWGAISRQIFGLNKTQSLPKSLEISNSRGALYINHRIHNIHTYSLKCVTTHIFPRNFF